MEEGYKSYFLQGEGSKEDAWLRMKWGMLSASEIDVLMIQAKEGLFGQGALTYIERVARETYTAFNTDENVETFAMKKGKVKEALAFAHYFRLMGRMPQLEYFGGGNPYFKKYSEGSGASPDCVAWIDKEKELVSFGAEFKCPDSKTHWRYLLKIKDQWDLKKESGDYYGQCQHNMMTFKTDLWHWTSYNEHYPFEDQMLIVEVKADKDYQTKLDLRIKQAEKEKWKLVAAMKQRHSK